MNFLWAFLGFCFLIVMHELGHFTAAKMVGMRVERFSLFFPPLLGKIKRGETEYAIGSIPLGGYVKITGMNPDEEFPPEIAGRTYSGSPVWKRIFVIAAGPAVNFAIAFILLAGIAMHEGKTFGTAKIDTVQAKSPAAAVLKPGDQVLSINGAPGAGAGLTNQQLEDRVVALRAKIAAGTCSGKPIEGCKSSVPVTVVVQRGTETKTLHITPSYSAAEKRMRLGVIFGTATQPVNALQAARVSVDTMWQVTRDTVSAIVKLVYSPQARKQVSSVVGAYDTTQEAVSEGAVPALTILALISLSLAVINLFPFLPLDGGHIFWALVEKARGGRGVATATLEKASIVGFGLVIALFAIGLTNDVGKLSRHESFLNPPAQSTPTPTPPVHK